MNRFFACRCWWLVAILLCAVALGLLLIHPSEPAYGGRKLSEWVADVPAPSYSYDDPDDSNAVHAIRQIGTNALPLRKSAAVYKTSNTSRISMLALASRSTFPSIVTRMTPGGGGGSLMTSSCGKG